MIVYIIIIIDPVYDEPSFPEPIYEHINRAHGFKENIQDSCTNCATEMTGNCTYYQAEPDPTITAFAQCPAYHEFRKL